MPRSEDALVGQLLHDGLAATSSSARWIDLGITAGMIRAGAMENAEKTISTSSLCEMCNSPRLLIVHPLKNRTDQLACSCMQSALVR